jgi:hypothetical protein
MVLYPLGLQMLVPVAGDHNLAEWWLGRQELLQADVKPAFDSLVLLVAWTVWKECDARVFRGSNGSMTSVCKALFQEVKLWCEARFRELRAFTPIWSLNSFIM